LCVDLKWVYHRRMTTWIFQANPDTFDIDGYLAATDTITWVVRQTHLARNIIEGDLVFLWKAAGKSKSDSGVIASARVIESPTVCEDDQSSLKFWRVQPEVSSQLRVKMRVERRANAKEIIQRSWCMDDPILKDMLILRMANQTNYLLSEAESVRMQALWSNTGRPWDRSESVAGLWAYHHTYGQSVSRGEQAIVTKVAIRIGRAVTGVYNKVMNFRSLDPRDPRDGLSGAGAIDRVVWAEFFDMTIGALQADRLEAAFRERWGTLEEIIEEDSPIDLGKVDRPKKASVRSWGQGRINDPILRRAIEMRAVELATKHYLAAGFEVEDTGAFESYDLRCSKAGKEIRVEVKGTTGQGKSIQLTTNEVKHAQSRESRVDLFIVSGIEIIRSPGGLQAIGGTIRHLEDWFPFDEHLQPASYTYTVPG
jgi:hypothetical protein